MYNLKILLYLQCTYIWAYMKSKTRFIQLEFYTNYDEPSDYLVLVEVVDDVPRASYCVRVPTPYAHFPRFPHIKN